MGLWVLARNDIARPLREALDQIDDPVKAKRHTDVSTRLLTEIRKYSNSCESALNKIKMCQYVDDRDIHKNFGELYEMQYIEEYQPAELNSLIVNEIHKYDMLMSHREKTNITVKDVSDLFDFE